MNLKDRLISGELAEIEGLYDFVKFQKDDVFTNEQYQQIYELNKRVVYYLRPKQTHLYSDRIHYHVLVCTLLPLDYKGDTLVSKDSNLCIIKIIHFILLICLFNFIY